MFDVVIRDGVVIDGTGSERLRADVGVTADRIAAIGDLQAVSASREICAAGQIVAPGFIDVHNHSDGWMHREPLLESKVRQGFSTEILMADGLGYAPVDETTARDWMYYLRTLDGLRMTDYRGWNSLEDFMAPLDHGNCQNSGFHIPWANVRSLVAGWGKSPLDDFQLQAACSEIRRGMEAGAVGLSTGLDYIVECFSSTRELTEVCKAMADFRGLYVTHIRYKKGVIAGVREAVEIGRDAGVAVHISHLKAQTAEQVQPLLEYIDREARQQVDFSFDVYPYQRSCTMLSSLLPYEIWEAGPLAAVGRLKDPQIRERFRHSLACYRLPLDRMKYSETCRMLSTNTRPTTTNRSHFCRISSGTLLTLAPPLHQPCELHHLNGNQTAGVRSFLECKPPLCSGFRKPLSRSLPQQLLNACLSPVLPK